MRRKDRDPAEETEERFNGRNPPDTVVIQALDAGTADATVSGPWGAHYPAPGAPVLLLIVSLLWGRLHRPVIGSVLQRRPPIGYDHLMPDTVEVGGVFVRKWTVIGDSAVGVREVGFNIARTPLGVDE